MRRALSKNQRLFLPKRLRSPQRLEKLHAEARSEAERLQKRKLEAERNAGLRV